MTKAEIIKEIRRLEGKQLRSMKSMYRNAYLKGPDALSILKSTDIWNKLSMVYGFNINKGFTALTKGLGGMNKAALLDYLDKLQDIDLSDKSRATDMNRFVNQETSRWRKWRGSTPGAPEVPEEIDWEKWLKLYELPSEYVAEAKWASGAEKVRTIIGLLKPQESVSPRQTEEEFASRNVFTPSDWDKVVSNARIVKSQGFNARYGF